MPLLAQDSVRYVRLHLRDKGTTPRSLGPGDSLYAAATAHLTARALARRSKVLSSTGLVTTDDLPVHAPYLNAITATGARAVQSSRWLNTVMVLADSTTIVRLKRLPFVSSSEVFRVQAPSQSAITKTTSFEFLQSALTSPPTYTTPECFADRHGLSTFQNRFMGIDEAHRIGIAGEGVLIGVIDAGFSWRSHVAFRKTRVVGEHDFLYGNDNTADEPEDSLATSSQQEHGTMVLSAMGATLEQSDTGSARALVGGAPRASFMLAKTEDLRFERRVEEDNFVAGLEWLEAQGVDVTNTSLGYTTFTNGEPPHPYSELDGNAVPASHAVNHAVALGVVCVISAGNDGRVGDFNYIGVPADADSSVTVAAVDSNDQLASFSSRGFPSMVPMKPDVAAFGVGNWVADAGAPDRFRTVQGTSLSAPMTTSVAALLISAAPELTPSQVRELLYRSGTHYANPDTAVGRGTVNAMRALRELARVRTVVGVPIVVRDKRSIAITAYTMRLRDAETWPLDTHLLARWRFRSGETIDVGGAQPVNGIARWTIPIGTDQRFNSSDSMAIEFLDARTRMTLRRDSFVLRDDGLDSHSTLCAKPLFAMLDHGYGSGYVPEPGHVDIYPNPFRDVARMNFLLLSDATVSLEIFSSVGERVATLIDHERMPAGFHSPIFDLRGLSSGAFYARLLVDGELRTGELLHYTN